MKSLLLSLFKWSMFFNGESKIYLIHVNVIRNCLRQAGLNSLDKVSAIKLIKGGIERVLRMTMVLPTFPERKVGRTEG